MKGLSKLREAIASKSGNLAVAGGAFVALTVLAGGMMLLFSLPNAGVFNDRVVQIFTENDALTSPNETNLLEVLAQSGTTFAEMLHFYRVIIFTLMVLAACLLFSSLYFLATNNALNRRLLEIERSGLHITSLQVDRTQKVVLINSLEFSLTDAACETLSVLCEARLDDEILSGVALEAMVSGKNEADCEEAAGATRIKRLRDHLGNQLVAQLLIKHVRRQGYMLTISPDVIRLQ